jgi:hypothetical protein
MTQDRSLIWRMHSFGVHLSQIQKAHCRQHLQQQQLQQVITINIRRVNTTLPQVEVKILKCSNLFVCSLSIKSCTSLIFTLARFNSSMDDKLVKGFCRGISCRCSHSKLVRQQSRSTGASGSTSCELFRTKLDKAYKVLRVEYPLHHGGRYNLLRPCKVSWNFADPNNTLNTSVLGVTYNHLLLISNNMQ